MRGTIQKVAAIIDEPNDRPKLKFQGSISGEDGNQYFFNCLNWQNKDTALGSVFEGQQVEFELKPPNKNGRVYPTNIRFLGEELQVQSQNPFSQVAHSYGRFKEFVFVKTDTIALALNHLIEGFSQSEYSTATVLFKKIATTFNGLHDADFSFSDSKDSPAVDFPIGFQTKDGQPVLLHCVKKAKCASTWYSESVVVNGQVYGQSVFSLINANWYDIEEAVHKIVQKDAASAIEMIQKIENRCFDNEHSFVYLRQGMACSSDEADELYIPTGYYEEGGNEVYLLCIQRNGLHGYGWYFCTATYTGAPITVFDKKIWLEKWAGYFSNDAFEKLADQTLEEQWSFGNRTDFGILRNYLRYTFSHQLTNGDIRYSQNRQYAAFNTGLPDRNTYKYLYALFEKIPEDHNQPLHPLYYRQKYKFTDFVIPGRGGNGKILSSNIRPFPNPPQYFEARSATVWELDFNANNQVTLPEYDDTHILIQRCERIPLNFYRASASKSIQLAKILDSDNTLEEKYKEIREFFKPVLENDPNTEVTNAYRELSNSLESVIHNAVKRLSWNWRAVVPCYNPERNETCFLLPVSFCDPIKPDRAMIATVSKFEEESIYTIHTVIPLDWAYLDARLVCRPESEWLAANFIDEQDEIE